jgi:hypothetical protein
VAAAAAVGAAEAGESGGGGKHDARHFFQHDAT